MGASPPLLTLFFSLFFDLLPPPLLHLPLLLLGLCLLTLVVLPLLVWLCRRFECALGQFLLRWRLKDLEISHLSIFAIRLAFLLFILDRNLLRTDLRAFLCLYHRLVRGYFNVRHVYIVVNVVLACVDLPSHVRIRVRIGHVPLLDRLHSSGLSWLVLLRTLATTDTLARLWRFAASHPWTRRHFLCLRDACILDWVGAPVVSHYRWLIRHIGVSGRVLHMRFAFVSMSACPLTLGLYAYLLRLLLSFHCFLGRVWASLALICSCWWSLCSNRFTPLLQQERCWSTAIYMGVWLMVVERRVVCYLPRKCIASQLLIQIIVELHLRRSPCTLVLNDDLPQLTPCTL